MIMTVDSVQRLRCRLARVAALHRFPAPPPHPHQRRAKDYQVRGDGARVNALPSRRRGWSLSRGITVFPIWMDRRFVPLSRWVRRFRRRRCHGASLTGARIFQRHVAYGRTAGQPIHAVGASVSRAASRRLCHGCRRRSRATRPCRCAEGTPQRTVNGGHRARSCSFAIRAYGSGRNACASSRGFPSCSVKCY